MPKPIYLICSESGAVDENTKFSSLFNLVEKVQFSTAQPSPGQILMARPVSLRMQAYWAREETDAPETRFEVQFVGIFPNGPQEIPLAGGEFQFTSPFQRLNVVGFQIAQCFGPGILWLEARIRRVGEEAWINRMEYPIVLEDITPSEPAAAQQPEQTTPQPPAQAG